MKTWFLYFSLILLVFPARETGFAEATTYTLYSCPLSLWSSLFSSSISKDCSSSRKKGIPYGIRHTYIQIGTKCYDWGDWNYPRVTSCYGSALSCCVQKRRYVKSGTTSCAYRIDEFNSAWRDQGRKYHFWSWNCQVYSDKMIKFLNTCNVNAPFG
ncbi:uncharacterized protein LOC132722963 [Ruditapes philippinarum]|uniref:uncharacterized protein LOC132722963 n=1 Tax=Ruditapes philippinarum TaxID=129788 RepID=UPI00295B505C|nr:uncharacterized protein LOC132722963 [Ruditapes philippinarum]